MKPVDLGLRRTLVLAEALVNEGIHDTACTTERRGWDREGEARKIVRFLSTSAGAPPPGTIN